MTNQKKTFPNKSSNDQLEYSREFFPKFYIEVKSKRVWTPA